MKRSKFDHPLISQAARRIQKTVCLTVLLILVVSFGTAADERTPTMPPGSFVVGKLTHDHPRLLATKQQFDELKKQIDENPQLKLWHTKLREKAERILAEPPSSYEIVGKLRLLLATRRRILERVYPLAMLYRIDGERHYADRAWQELEAAANFPDWNPKSFLETAEMINAFAIGYDWLYDCWTKEQRATLLEAIVEKGLKPALKNTQSKSPPLWVRAENNISEVCNSGIGMGALAVGDQEPELAADILDFVLEHLPKAMTHYAPDGDWSEGPMY